VEITDLSDAEIDSLTDAIFKRHGIDFTGYEMKSLKRRVLRILHLHKLSSIHELWAKILKEKDFVHEVVNEISVGLTSMFRDPELWVHLKERILPSLATKPGINIWHAGCSSGEEIYTMAIVLKEIGLLSKAKALATDINSDALKTAKEGSFHKIKMIEYTNHYDKYNPKGKFSDYYKVEDSYAHMFLTLNQHVTFNQHNLITQPMPKKFDIIFCRNVMIYFDQPTKEKLLQQFHQALNPGGYFIIGFFDSVVSLIDKNMFAFEHPNLRIYRKMTEKMVEVPAFQVNN